MKTNLKLLQVIVVIAGILVLAQPVFATDCNHNGVDDLQDIAPPQLNFQELQHHADTNHMYYPENIGFGDIDHDGRQDIIIASPGDPSIGYPNASVTIYRNLGINPNNGEVLFSLFASFPLPAPELHVWLAIDDFNHDGAVDIIVGEAGDPSNYESGKVLILQNNGDGTFRQKFTFTTPSDFGPIIGLFEANLDGNDFPDVVVIYYDLDVISVLLNSGQTDSDGLISFSNTQYNFPGAGILYVAAGDMDGDGDVDLVLPSYYTRETIILKNDGTGTFSSSQHIPLTSYRPYTDVVDDFNHDGKMDIALGHGSSISVWLNRGINENHDILFDPPMIFQSPQHIARLKLIDIDSDGFSDLAGISDFHFSEADTAIIFRNSRNGNFADSIQLPAGEAPSMISAGDVNNDGIPDLGISDVGGRTPNPEAGGFSIIVNQTIPPHSLDLNNNQIPDECEQNQNHPPVLTIAPSTTIHGREGRPVTFSALATDADGDRTQISMDGLPAGARVVPDRNGNYVFMWTPNYVQAGTYHVTVNATDGHDTVHQIVTLIIANAPAPRTGTPQAVPVN